MKMKRFATVLMAAAMTLSLAACGSTGASSGSASGSASASASGSAASSAAGSDKAYVQDKGALVVGITEFEPMDYQDANGEWIGFDADLAKAFAQSLGVEAQFQVIDWDAKIMELDGKTIDVVWNGMTLTDAVMEAMECTNAYCQNAQVVISK